MTKKNIHLVYSILLSISLILVGVALIVACIDIYLSGDDPFSRETVAAAFSQIAVPVYLCIALVIGGFLMDGFSPLPGKKAPVEKQYALILSKLHKKLDPAACSPTLSAAIAGQQKLRRRHRITGLILLVLGSAVFLYYGTNPANFHQSQINESMVKAMYWFIPCLAVPFGYSVYSAYRSRASMQLEIAFVKQALTAGRQPAAPAACQPVKDCSKLLLIARCALLGIGLVILIYGFFAGGTKDVLTKAINICTECVGLG